ncbi:MAG: hypothetical protein AUK44_07965 [Porphyromonadaceae bacterium CG2_30_38_12]|nr:MAG: hypothetical protein AUK44_07965 [Porphyromonadaceae bacterium CG2_30_38_12]
MDINNLVVSKNDLLYQKDNVIAQNTKIIAQRDATIYDLQFQLAQLRRAIFGSKSERHVPEKVKQLYDALKYKYAPFKKKKSVVHKSELEDSQLIEQHDFWSD